MTSYPHFPPETAENFTQGRYRDTYAFIDSEKSDLSGRSVFITGASKGVGRAIAVSCARAGAAKIAVGARSSSGDLRKELLDAAQSCSKAPPEVLELKLDVEERESIRKAAAEVKKAFGTLDILVNNAGYLPPFAPLLESDEAEYIKSWNVNYIGVYFVTKDFLPLLLDKEDGLKTIVNISSAGGHRLRPGASS